jgi:uncharacterized protein (DUF2384 family)
MTSLRYDEVTPLVTDDLAAGLLAEITAGTVELAARETVPASVRDLVRELPARLRADTPAAAFAGDPYLTESVYAGAARAAAAQLADDPRLARRETRLALEQVRQALRDIVDGRPADEDVPPAVVARWLEGTLTVPQAEVARLVGTSARTWQRWLAGAQPEPDALARLRRIARLAMHLRHSLTGPGVARWFERPHPLIKEGGGCPADLLDDPGEYARLQALAAGTRATQAS